ncbi:MAG: hypothetical protein ABSA67_12135 [Candidatus Brocadiia bacterium]|jgi:hypothetical protein
MRNLLIASCVAVLLAASPGFAQAPKPPAPGFYALYCWSEGYLEYAQDVQKVGIRWLRIGNWTGSAQDEKALLLATANGVHFVPVLGVETGKTIQADAAVENFRQAVRTAVQRYGPGGTFWKEHPEADASGAIRYWEIWNEPNIEFLNPPDDPNGMLRTQLYAPLLKAATEEIHKLDPGAVVIGFNVAGGTPDAPGPPADGMFTRLKYIGWRKFIKDVTALAGPESFDAVGLHPYTIPRGPEAGGVVAGLDMLKEAAREGKFENKPVWFTEVGFPLDYPRNQQVRDERQQACFTTRLFALAAAHGVTQVQIMYIEDIIYGPDNTRRTFGFFTAPSQWRQQATATKVMERLIPDPRKGSRSLGDEKTGIFSYAFDGAANHIVIMAWTDGDKPVPCELKAPPGPGETVTLVDMLGKCSTAKIEDGKVKLDLSEAPVYLVRAAQEDVEKLLKD